MEDLTTSRRDQTITRRAFLQQVLALTGVSAGAVLLNACGVSSTTTTAVPPAAQQPTALATSAPAATTAATTSTEGAPTTASTSQDATPKIVAAANAFLATLN